MKIVKIIVTTFALSLSLNIIGPIISSRNAYADKAPSYYEHLMEVEGIENVWAVNGFYNKGVDLYQYSADGRIGTYDPYQAQKLVRKGSDMFVEDTIFIRQDHKHMKNVTGKIKELREDAIKNDITIRARKLSEILGELDNTKKHLNSELMYTNVNWAYPYMDFLRQLNFENYINFKNRNFSYIEEGRHPDGTVNDYLKNSNNQLRTVFVASGKDDCVMEITDKILSGENDYNIIPMDEKYYEADLLIDENKNPIDSKSKIFANLYQLDSSIENPFIKLYLDPYISQIAVSRMIKDDQVYLQFLAVYNDDKPFEKYQPAVNNINYTINATKEYKDDYTFTYGDKDLQSKHGYAVERKRLARTVYNNLVQANAAKILLDQSANTIRPIEKSLRTAVDNTEKLKDRYYKALLNKKDIKDENEKEAIIELLRLYFDKRIESEKEKELALKIYDNLIYRNAADTLLINTPETVRPISSQLQDAINKSAATTNKALDSLK